MYLIDIFIWWNVYHFWWNMNFYIVLLWLICSCHSVFLGTSSSGFIYKFLYSLGFSIPPHWLNRFLLQNWPEKVRVFRNEIQSFKAINYFTSPPEGPDYWFEYIGIFSKMKCYWISNIYYNVVITWRNKNYGDKTSKVKTQVLIWLKHFHFLFKV